MSIFVVCGSPSSRIESIFHLLEGQGVNRALAAKGHRGLGIEGLLSRLVPSGSNTSRKPSTLKPGKVFEQAAVDILIANWEQTHWGWSDSRNVWILDFLKVLDQSIRFLLIHESPERALARAITQNEQPIDIEESLNQWLEHETAMLRFYHRNRNQALLLDAEAFLNNPLDHFEALAEVSDLPSKPLDLPHSNGEKIPSLAFLIGQLELENHPETIIFNREMEASLSISIKTVEPKNLALTRDAAEEFRRIHINQRQLLEQVSALEVTRSALEDSQHQLKKSLHRLTNELENKQGELTASEQRIQTLEKDVHSNVFKAADETYQRRLSEEAEENGLLLAQLHQVQEELEHYFLKFQESQQVIKRHESRIQRLLSKEVTLYDFESLRLIEKTRDGNDIHTRWELEGLAAAGRMIDKVKVSLVREADYPEIWIHQDEAQEALVRWPSQSQADQILKIQPEGSDTTRLLRLSTLFALSQADWDLMGRLSELFSEELGKLVETGASRLDRSEILDCLGIVNAIGRKLQAFPSIWRFGKVQLKNLQINPDYAHLWLALEDAKFGDQEWPQFEFRLSAAHIDQQSFGDFPKLEFPEVSGEPPQFSGWFEESRDDFGPKFELRFNRLTGDLDLEALNHLTPADRDQLLQLVGSLPEILSHLTHLGIDLGRPVADWQETATTVLQILHQSQNAPEVPKTTREDRPKKSRTTRTQKKSSVTETKPKPRKKPVRKSS